MYRLVFLCFLLLLTACNNMAKQLNGTIKPPQGYAYAIFSLTGDTFDPSNASTSLNWRSLDTTTKGTVWANLDIDTIFGGKKYGMSSGKLQLLTLAPGNYEFTNAYATWIEEQAFLRYRKIQTYPLNLRFSVQPNEVVYLGEVNLDMSYRPEAKIIDSHLRDFAHIQRIWKVLDTSSINIYVLPNK